MVRLRNYLGITVGAVITALALDMFLIPNKIAAGGTSGLAIVLHHLFGWPVGMTMLAMDIPLTLISIRFLGTHFGVNTVFGAATLSVATDLLAPYAPVLTQDVLLSALYGGVLSGVGLGLVFRFKGTTAGSDLAAALINRFTGISLGHALLAVDFFVIATAGLVFGSAEISLYALISLVATTKVIDIIQEGLSSAKAFFIMTEHSEAVADALMNELGRGLTFFQGRGAYTSRELEILLCVVSTSEVTRLKDIIYHHDKKAFVIGVDAHEVLGEGFKQINLRK